MMSVASLSICRLASSVVISLARKAATARPIRNAVIITRLNLVLSPMPFSIPPSFSPHAVGESCCLFSAQAAGHFALDFELVAADGGPGFGSECPVNPATVVSHGCQHRLDPAPILLGHLILVRHGQALRRRNRQCNDRWLGRRRRGMDGSGGRCRGRDRRGRRRSVAPPARLDRGTFNRRNEMRRHGSSLGK